MRRFLTIAFMMLFGAHSVAMAGLINISPNASGSLAVDETVFGGDTTTTDNFPGGEAPQFALDGNIGTKYLQFGGDDGTVFNTGILVFFDEPVLVEGIRFGFGNDAPERDPWTLTIEGSNAVNEATYGTPPSMVADGPAWNPILSSGVTGLVAEDDTFADAYQARSTYTDEAPFNRSASSFTNTTAYSAYRILFPEMRTAVWGANIDIMQVAEIQLMAVPEPGSLVLLSVSVLGLFLTRRRHR